MFEPTPGSSSFEVRWYANGKSRQEEFGSEEGALNRVQEAFELDEPSQVEVIKWVHRWNNPGCLPPIVANSCGLTICKIVDGELVRESINIFG